jgi:hypothetical protein
MGDPRTNPPEPAPEPLPEWFPYTREELWDMSLLDLAERSPDFLRRQGYTTDDVQAAENRRAARENREPKTWNL